MNINQKDKSSYKKQIANLKYLPLLILLSGLVTTLFTNYLLARSEIRVKEENFNALAHKISLRIQQRVDDYRLVLQGVAGLFAASDQVNRKEFHDYVARIEIDKNYPGIQSVGYAQWVADTEKSKHVAAVRKQGFSTYSIHPEGKRAHYSPYLYLEPFTATNQKAFGFDALSEPIRHSVMTNARDLNKAKITDMLDLVKDEGDKNQPSFVMYFPVYQNNMPHQSVSQRQSYLTGWVFIQFHMDGLIANIPEDHANNIVLKLYDSKTITSDKLMYQNINLVKLQPDSNYQYQFTESLNVLDHSWTVKINQFEANQALTKALGKPSILLTGGLLSLMLSGLIWQLIVLREQAERLAKSIIIDLEESESRLKVATEDAIEGLWDWDIETHQFYFSDKAKNILKLNHDYQNSDITTWEQHIYPDDKAEAIAKMQACLNSKTSQYSCEYRVNWIDNGKRWILDRGTVIKRDATGRPLRIIGTLLDITDHKQQESLLVESEKRFRTIADAAPILIWMTDIDKLCVWFNKIWLNFTGRTMLQERGNGWIEGVHPDDLQNFLETFTASFEARKPFIMEFRLRRHDGEYRWVLSSGVPRLDEQGFFSGFMGSCADISELKFSQIALKKSEQRAHLALAELEYQKYALDQHAIVATTDVKGTITYVNDKFCQISGYSAQELLGQNHRILNSGHHPREFFANLYETIANGKVWHGEICNRAKNGKLYWVLTTIVPFLNEQGKPKQYIAIRADITAKKMSTEHQLQESLLQKEILLKEVYHRVKNNLQVVSSLLNLQAKTIINTEAIALLKDSSNRIKSMALLHEKLYQSADLSKIDIKEYFLSLVDYLLFAFDIRDRIKLNLIADNIFLNVDNAIPCGLIVNEIVSNAFKHAFPDNRKGEVTIEFYETSDEYRMTIADNGVGLPAGWRLEDCKSLGLELVNALTQQLFGNLSYKNSKGAKFSIQFPHSILIREEE